jgi:predicted alpha/beta hydrolase family esterase
LLVDEIVIIHAKDDETVPFENAKYFAKKINAEFIALET